MVWHGRRSVKIRTLLVWGFLAFATVTAMAQTQKLVAIRGGPKVSIVAPMGYSYETKVNIDGSVAVHMENPVWAITIDVLIAQENDPAITTREWQQNKLISFVAGVLADSKQTDYDFQPLPGGSGVYCVFQAAGAPKPKPGETIPNTHLTGGLKAWKGCVVITRILSADTTSPEYQEALETFATGIKKV